ncbi:glycosyltransferase family 4 protein [Actinoallomurus soli]|uniref:glycosyltransferase family 4 protein n=1 Tax=Actinoallomurus soli TaxID=2952535 RepID=UPI0020939BD5|nr:glycosyltransferase family 1 protein [Actinoallomurus soli]MCO5967714.1 glycosyltransferase family 1 protein [Actinoallomurus soli]
MKVAIVTESFLPRVNGVTNSVCRVVEHLAGCGSEVLVVAPGPGPGGHAGQPVRLTRGVALPFYRSFVVGVPTRQVTAVLSEFGPDVVHLAAPVTLGASGVAAARRLDVPTVAVFQTDVVGFARRYGLRGADHLVWAWLRHLHEQADRTLVPSTPTLDLLRRRGLPRLALWARGVDDRRFHPRHRSAELRARLAPDGRLLVGYVGRLAAEKRPSLLRHLADLPDVRLVVVGDGPAGRRLRRILPEAVFTGFRTGRELSELVASLDVFVHTGADETFCQAVQEALAAGVPVVAPAAGGPLDLVKPGYNGLLYPPDDAASLRAAVARLVADAPMRRRMAAHARLSVRGRDWDTVCAELVGHYHAVRSGRSERQAA